MSRELVVSSDCHAGLPPGHYRDYLDPQYREQYQANIQVQLDSARQMRMHLDAFEEQLERCGGPWILGEAFTLADVSWLVIFQRLVQVDSLDLFVGGNLRPRCSEYWERLKSRPSYRDAILDHSHPMIDYGTKRLREAKAASPALKTALGR